MASNVSEKTDRDTVSGFENEKPEVSLNGGGEDGSESEDRNRQDDSKDIEKLRQLLIRAEGVGEVLPTAVEKSSQKDSKLSEATLPIVEENIRQSVLRDPKILAEALFPVIGPAIRKAISEALSSMVQNMNQTLEYSISPKSLKWRLEAYQTGKSFGEIVMLKTLQYRVEQVFLIHKETGLLLQHVAAKPEDTEDADMVSAMLTAIEDFVQDSFKASEEATLDSLKIKELSVWIESSPDAVVAGVIRGNPPLSLRETFLEATEQIQYQHESDLDNYSGDAEVFAKARPILENCLSFQAAEKKETSGFLNPLTVLGSLLGIFFLIVGFFYVRDHLRWNQYLADLEAEPGIVVTEANRGWFSHSVSGLRDSLAAEPNEILKNSGYESNDLFQNWKAFHDVGDEISLKRAKKQLKPPNGVELRLKDQVLTAKGVVPADWLTESKKMIPILVGVNELRTEGDERSGLIASIESKTLIFECNTIKLAANQEKLLDELTASIDKIAEAESEFQLVIRGFASKTGTKEANLEISKKRSKVVVNELKTRSQKIANLQQTNREFIKVVGEGQDPKSEDCKVMFRVNLEEK